jgi:hypothetical protein
MPPDENTAPDDLAAVKGPDATAGPPDLEGDADAVDQAAPLEDADAPVSDPDMGDWVEGRPPAA